MKKHKVAIYIRVSTKKQVEEGYSLDAQKERLEKLCETNGYIVYKVYADEGKSGKDTNRPAFQEMMKDMRNGEFDKILVLKLDRISRSVIDLEVMIKEMQEFDVNFESASEKIDTSSSFGMMFVRLLAIFAQFERERIKERINDTFETMIQEGRAITGEQPIGYKKDDNNKVVIDEEESLIVNYFFDTYEKYQSIRQASLYTNEKFGLTRNIKNYSKMVTQTHYYGSYKGNDNYCPPYMTKERWDKLQEIKKSKNIKVNSANRIYLFTGLLIDSNCQTKLTGNHAQKKTKGIYLYRCHKAISKLCHSTKNINEEKLEQFLLDNLNIYIDNYFNTLDLEYTKSKTDYKDNTKRIADIKEEMKRTTNSYNKGRMEEEEYDKIYEDLEKKLAKLQQEPKKKDIKVLKDLTKMDWKSMYKELTRENKRAFWRSIISSIEIDPMNYKEGREYIKINFV
jgi:DNA invertase Pin-like site-specific DNA recombinase/adenosyl cobinamide kinase/adenosyl cobinamide phosphate guanylyltransferase